MLPEPVFREVLLRMVVAVLVGCVVGVDRNLRGKPTGVKTLGLVALGACLVTMAGAGFAVSGVGIDANAARAIQGIVTGVGFLGAGVIVQTGGEEKIRGLTTAASIWVTAALGIVCGIGAWSIALTATVLLVLLLILGRPVERALHRRWLKLPQQDRDIITRHEE
ncbi:MULTISPECIES: MgtC/SapB family protein [unclassified Paraburkholderia]|jgi:putative Mg2+ transporter-C (MgtC) family protein|uniref:MgtC/SapB family protein n=1 Tax=unclassified Paraburkholderia TaxID=2615204 RepID=UPI0010EC84F2|nr:MgtC/SapB family protein [Paraburkholderia sp. BL9I2N2]TCK88531.1 putative Mg2+ transporter-C (MgtC) family protein [Paraburkholderia sp. BL9I2N2]